MITLLADLSRLFLQTPKDLIVWDVEGLGFEPRLAFELPETRSCSAGTRREVRTFFYWKVVETGAVVAKVHQDVVEGLVMSRLTENRARRGPEPSHWQEMPQTERV